MPRYEPGDLVVDATDDRADRGTAVVVRTLDVTAENHFIGSLDATVAAVNTDYPATDPVVEIIFAGHLDRTVGTWRSILRTVRQSDDLTFREFLEQYRDEWGVPLREYAYPESRLEPRRYCPVHRVRAEYVNVPDRPQYYLCPFDGCGEQIDAPEDALNADDERPRPVDTWTLDEVTGTAAPPEEHP